jgi:HEXXH motif-containing protein
MIVTDVIRISARSFAELAAGGGDAETMAGLRGGQLSRRRCLLAALVNAMRSPAAEAYFELLVRAEERSPRVVRDVLMFPQVGAWAATALRRLRVAGATCTDHDLSYLGAVCCIAAARAGLEICIELPTMDGVVTLPSWGRAEMRGLSVVVTTTRGRLRIGDLLAPEDPAVDVPGWHGLHVLEVTCDGLSLRLVVDDLDPHRDVHGLGAAERLTADALALWRARLDEAWSVLVRWHRRYAESISAGLNTLVPLAPPPSGFGVNATGMESFGAVSMTPPTDPLALAAALLHEWQHAKLGALLDLLTLHTAGSEPRFYAPWRDDPRPLGGLLHGVYAFLGVTDFWRVQRRVLDGSRARVAEFEFARWRAMVWQTTRLLQRADSLTEEGRLFLSGLADRQELWLDEPVSDTAATLAAEVNVEHRVMWRLRNRVPKAGRVAELADDWLAGAAASTGAVPATLSPAAGLAASSNVRYELAALRLADPERFAGLCATPAAIAGEVPHASPGDIAHARGDIAGARTEYLRRLAERPDDHRAWIGLALVADPDDEAALWLLPELVVALHGEVRRRGAAAPDPLRLTLWLHHVAAASRGVDGDA